MEKFLDVDVLDTLHSIAKQILVRGWDDFAYDKKRIIEAARYKVPRQCTLVWLCHPDGTELYQESDTFVRNTMAYRAVQDYQSDNRIFPTAAYYEIELSGEVRGIVRGNIYAVDSHRFAAFVKDAMPICSTEAEIVSARESAQAELRRKRLALQISCLDVHLERLVQNQINSETKRIAAVIQKMDQPNCPYAPFHIAAVSNYFLAKASKGDIEKLLAKLREELQSPSLFLGNFGKDNIPCIFQHHDEHKQDKPSIMAKLAAKPILGKHSIKQKNQEER